MNDMLLLRSLLAAAAAALLATVASAAELSEHVVTLTLKDHRFTPAQITVPAGRTVRIQLVNQDGALEEFDSLDLGVEQDVTPHGRTTFNVGPLKPGTYKFMGELHADTAAGEITAVAEP